MYIFIVLLLSILSYKDVKRGIISGVSSFTALKKGVLVIWLLLTFILSIRYAQGTDFIEYEAQYESIDSNMSFFVNALYHGEIGWYILLLLFKKLSLSFDVFIVFISLIMMISLKKSIERFSPYHFFSLLLFFPTYYLTYCQSALRQGLVLSIFFGFGLTLLINRKYKSYFLLTSLLVTLHTSSVALFLLPFVHFVKLKQEYSLVVMLVVLSTASSTITTHILHYENDADGGKLLGILLRLILLLLIIYMYKNSKINSSEYTIYINFFFKVYFLGFLIFMLLSASPLLSQRFTMPMKATEIFLIPLLLYQLKLNISHGVYGCNTFKMYRKRIFVALFFILISNVETYKNLDAYITGYYREGTTPITYPIITIFNKEDVSTYKL